MMQRKISVRKGSNAALDPHGVHSEINLNPSRSSSSILTIVRVQQPTTLVPNNDPRPASPQRRIHRRIGQNSSNQPSPPPSDNRLSFAFSSFSSNKDQPTSPTSSPRLRPSSPHHGRSGSLSGKPRLTPDQLVDLARQATNPKSLSGSSAAVTPATFTPLPDDIYLPFIDRPSEVATLISSPPDLKLFSLLAQTFPNNQHIITDPSIQLPPDPIQWSYNHLIHHLTRIDRDTAPDPIWAIAARKCIRFHSELIWERIKGALGVPPELDIDYDCYDDHSILNTVQALDPGHWTDCSAIAESPQSKRLSLGSEHDALTDDQSTSGLPIDTRSPPSTINHQDDAGLLSIEPLLAVPPSVSTSFSSLSNPAGDGLGDIAEGAEEDETELISITEPTTSDSGLVAGQEDSDLISPNQIQGIKISTSPILSSNSFCTSPLMSPISPLPPYPPVGATVGPPPGQTSGFTSSLPHSRASSFSSIGPFQRSESTGGLAASWSAAAAGGNYGSSVFTGSEAGDTRERDGGHLSDGDRPPGQPLFPSNFARLAMGPTLRAK